MSNNKDFKVKNGIQPTAYHEAVGTVTSGSVGYYLAGASYDSVSFSVASEEITPEGIFFKPDGTKMYITGTTSDRVHEYDLSTAWDLSTASFLQSFFVGSQDTFPHELFFKPDGTKMYVLGTAGDDVNEYDLSTAWDVSTAVFNQVFSVAAQDAGPFGLFFKPDGTKMYVSGNSDAIYEYDLSTAWDVSSASYLQTFSVASEDNIPDSVFFKPDGTKMYVLGNGGNDVNEYTLSTAWDISTASYTRNFSVASEDSSPNGLFFKSDGTKMYMIGSTTDTIYQYSTVLTTKTLDLSTGSVFEVTPTSDIQVTLSNPAASGTSSGATLLLNSVATSTYDLANAVYDGVSFSVAAQDTQPYEVTFKPDGTKMYIVGITGDNVYEYDLSTAWDISTASFLQSFSVAAQDTSPLGVSFKTDGTKMYIVGGAGQDVNEYNLSTAWNLSTASFLQRFSVAAQETSPRSVFFKTDGNKMYVIGWSGKDVNEYNLSTAWDVSTASFSQTFSVAAQASQPYGLFFKSDGTGMYVIDETSASVFEYNLITPWDVSTASFLQSFSVSAQETGPLGVSFKPDGTKMYIIGYGGDTIYQYSTATPATITYDSALQWSGGTAPTSPAIGETDIITFNTTDGGTTYKSVQSIDGAK